MFRYILILLLTTLLFGCRTNKVIQFPKHLLKVETSLKTFKPRDSSKKKWCSLDLTKDSIPGLSLTKAYGDLKNKAVREIVVAVIDTETDINHIAFKNNVWKNPNEILGNNIDDDNNGYIDDNNGWNFLGNDNGENIVDANNEYVRVYRYYRDIFKNIDTTNIKQNRIESFKLFKAIEKEYLEERFKTEKRYHSAHKLYTKYIKARKALKEYFPNYKYSIEILSTIDTVNNNLAEHVNLISQVIKFKDNDENLIRNYELRKNKYDKRDNVDFDERILLGDNSNDITDINYGNNLVSSNLDLYLHGTKVSGVINEDYIKLMLLAIAPYGDTHDKDIALAIRYAVDNGAKVINMSFGKNHSLHRDWVFDAFKYAEKKNVLIVSSAGNSAYNLNEYNNYYPNDNVDNGKEVSDNFLLVGATSMNCNENLIYRYSNYGSNDVDIFAPGVDIYTTVPNNKYEYDSGTSLAAALTSKVAALIFSHYPNLTASQVKHIIMDSGVEYTFPVKTPTTEDKDKMTPFNELSKSGKIVNAYNALIMADSVSKVNKRRKE